jgi:hypothetical protein
VNSIMIVTVSAKLIFGAWGLPTQIKTFETLPSVQCITKRDALRTEFGYASKNKLGSPVPDYYYAECYQVPEHKHD